MWHASTSRWFTPSSQEAIDNATEAYTILIGEYGWTEAACAGMFGNIDYEGMWNPWSWQGSGSPANGALTRAQAQAEHGTSHGYGLIGWTPSGKYQFNNFQSAGGVTYFPNYNQESYAGYGPYFKNEENAALASDGAAQIRLIAEGIERSSVNLWYHQSGEHPYNYTAHQFKALDDPEEAALAWLWRAERPSSIFDPDTRPITEGRRKQAALDWMDRLDWSHHKDGVIPTMLALMASSQKWIYKL